MKASEIIKVLQAEIDKRGDLPVVLYGTYGAESDVFGIAPPENVEKERYAKEIWIWTAIHTG